MSDHGTTTGTHETLDAALAAAESMIAAGASEVTIYVPPIRLQAAQTREAVQTHSERTA